MSANKPTIREKLEKDVDPSIARWTIVLLGVTLVALTAWAFVVNPGAGWGFLVTAAGLVVTLLTRKSSSYWFWAASLLLSVIGLLLVITSLPNLAT